MFVLGDDPRLAAARSASRPPASAVWCGRRRPRSRLPSPTLARVKRCVVMIESVARHLSRGGRALDRSVVWGGGPEYQLEARFEE